MITEKSLLENIDGRPDPYKEMRSAPSAYKMRYKSTPGNKTRHFSFSLKWLQRIGATNKRVKIAYIKEENVVAFKFDDYGRRLGHVQANHAYISIDKSASPDLPDTAKTCGAKTFSKSDGWYYCTLDHIIVED